MNNMQSILDDHFLTPSDFPWLLTLYDKLSEKTLKHNAHCILRMQSKKDLINTIQEFKAFIQKLSHTHSDITDVHLYQYILEKTTTIHTNVKILFILLITCNICTYFLSIHFDLLTHPFVNYFIQVSTLSGCLPASPFTSSYRYRQLDIHGYSLFEHKSLAERSITKKMCNINKYIRSRDTMNIDITMPINIDITLQSLIHFSNTINIILEYFIYKIASKLDSIERGLFLVRHQFLDNIHKILDKLERYLKRRNPDYDYAHVILAILLRHDHELLIAANTSLNKVLQKPTRNAIATMKAKNNNYKVYETNFIEMLYREGFLMIEISIMAISYLSLSHITYTKWCLLLQSTIWTTSLLVFMWSLFCTSYKFSAKIEQAYMLPTLTNNKGTLYKTLKKR